MRNSHTPCDQLWRTNSPGISVSSRLDPNVTVAGFAKLSGRSPRHGIARCTVPGSGTATACYTRPLRPSLLTTSLAGTGARIAGGCLATGLASMAFAYNPYFGVAIPLLVISGGATIIVITSCNMLLQHLVPENLRGRVMALYTMSFIGMLPVGSLLAGSLSNLIGVKPVFVASGLAGVVISYVLWRKLPGLREQTRPVLAERSLPSH